MQGLACAKLGSCGLASARLALATNTWRVDDVMKVRRERFADVPVIPLHLLSGTWWDAHPGLRPDESHATTDCTHFCASPFLFEPVWWAVRTALAAPRR